MPDNAVRIPMALTSDEIKLGVADELYRAILASLGKTCTLNSTSFPKFRARWWVEFEMDDFGRTEKASIGGNLGGPVTAEATRIEGTIDPMPPDAFRRKSKQPIPAPVVIKKKDETGPSMTQTRRGRGKGKDA